MALITNIVGYWKMDGNSNDSVNTNNGTDTSVIYSTANGIINQGGGLNGTTSLVKITNNSALDPTTAMTISMWVKATTVASGNTFLCKSITGDVGGNVQYGIGLFGAGTTIEGAMKIGGSVKFLNTGVTMPTGSFQFLCLTYDGSNLTVYQNGSAIGSPMSVTGSITTDTNYLAFGTENSLGGSFLNGDVDEIGIWSRALTGTEITQLYNSGVGLQYPFTSTINGNFFLATA